MQKFKNNKVTNKFGKALKIENALSCCKRKCICGHTQIITKRKNLEYVICTHCGGRIYYDKIKQKEHDNKCNKEEFKRRLISIYNNAIKGK